MSNCIEFNHYNLDEIYRDILETYNLCSKTKLSKSSIPQLDVKEFMNYEAFFINYMSKNLPCLIKGISTSWVCSILWINPGNEITIAFEKLDKLYGHMMVPVVTKERNGGPCETKEWLFRDYLQYLQRTNVKETNESFSYLRDWHLVKTLGNHQEFYKVPKYFASDWLNEYATDTKEDDYMFVYIGPKNSWTGLHIDVYESYSWSINICGRKRWWLIPPGVDIAASDSGKLLSETDFLEKKIPYICVDQEVNNAIFVPSGWHHQVLNLEPTISINHNWMNGCNIRFTYKALRKSYCSIQNEIIHLKDTPDYKENCELILNSLFGINHKKKIEIILHIAKKRLNQLKGVNTTFGEYILGNIHAKFDLESITRLLKDIFETPDISEILGMSFLNELKALENEILKKLYELDI